MFNGFLCFLVGLILNVGIPPGEVGMISVRRHGDVLHCSIHRENLSYVILVHVSSQAADVDFGRFGRRCPLLPARGAAGKNEANSTVKRTQIRYTCK